MAEKVWNIKNTDKEEAEKLASELNTSVEFAALLINRGIKDKTSAEMFFNCDIERLHDPFLMKGIKEAVDIIKDSVAKGEKVGVFGDYDADGVTSTVLMCEALAYLSADFAYYLPHRIEEGYGLSPEGIKWALEQNIKLVITVDNGTSNIKEITKLKSHLIRVIVTDHHEVPHNLPPADVIINPKQKDCVYPNKDLSGVGVTFKLTQALFADKPEAWKSWVYLPAIGTLADCMDLSVENRIIVKEGIKQINENPSVGVKAILLAAVYKNKVDSQTIGFVIGPRINAAGRLDNAELACELLLSRDKTKANELAQQLNALNIKRQKVEAKIQKEIENMFMDDPQIVDKNILFLFSKEWHIGVLGIVASKLSEKFGKPVFLMAAKDNYIKGSARGPGNFNIFEMLEKCEKHLMHFGGHKGAGGFSFMEENKDKVFEILNKEAAKYGEAVETVDIDMALPLSSINIDFVKKISELEPFGRNNAEPVFLIRNIHIQDASLVGNPPVHLKMNIKQDNHTQKVIGFRKDHLYQHIYPESFFYDIVFNLGIDTYMGIEKINLICLDIKKPDEFAKSVVRKSMGMHETLNGKNGKTIVDGRNLKDKDGYIENMMSHKGKIVVLFFTEKDAFVSSKNFPKAKFIDEFNGGEDTMAVFAGYESLEKLPGDIAFEDIILYGIPPHYDDFLKVIDILKPETKLHVLFGYRELAGKKLDIKNRFLSRQKLSKIYNIICRFKKRGDEINNNDFSEMLKKYDVAPSDFEKAAGVFEELGVCKLIKNNDKIGFEINKVKNDLENSLKYKEIVKRNKDMEKMIGIFEDIYLKKLRDNIKHRKEKVLTEGSVS